MDDMKGSLPAGITLLPEYVASVPMSMVMKQGESTGISRVVRPDGQPLFNARKQTPMTYESTEYFDAVSDRNLFEMRSHHTLTTKTWSGYSYPSTVKLFDLTLKKKGVAMLVNYTGTRQTRLTFNYTPSKLGESATMTCDDVVVATVRSELSHGATTSTTYFSIESGMDPLIVLVLETVSHEKAVQKPGLGTMFADLFDKTISGVGAMS